MSEHVGLCKAQFKYEAVDEGHLSLMVGDIIEIIQKDDSGWWQGRLQNDPSKEGLFPYNYVKEIETPGSSNSPPTSEISKPKDIGSPAPLMNENKNEEETKRASSPKSAAIFDTDALGDQSRASLVASSNTNLLTSSTRGGAPSDETKLKDVKLSMPKSERREFKPEATQKKKKEQTSFRMWAHVMVTYYISIFLVVLGLSAMVYGGEGRGLVSPENEITAGVFAFLYGPGLYYVETSRKGAPLLESFPARGAIWFASGIFFLPSFATITVAFSLLFAGFFDALGFYLGEKFKKPRARKGDPPSFVEQWKIYFKKQVAKGRVFVFFCVYLLANLIAFIVTVVIWTKAVDEMDDDKKLSGWAPYAKGFGCMIDINSSLILLPVCRTLLRYLYNLATLDQSCLAKSLRTIFSFIPIDKNHMLHKQLAKLSFFAVIGHTLMHFINYSAKPEQTVDKFGHWPFISGMMLLIIMVFIYSGGSDMVKRSNFEVFWYSHHLFIAYFAICLLHGKGGWNPNFWKYLLLPGSLYIMERIYRILRSQNEVRVMSMMAMKPRLISFEFDKDSAFGAAGYREGQYVFLCCPSVKKYEWHPFTISSPPHKPTWTVHIQTQGEGSWTQSVADYCLSIAPPGVKSFSLTSRGSDGQISPGRTQGPDGKQLFLVDGPHSAPTQHMTEYEHVLVAGAGIGLTPVAACVQSVVFHRWKFTVGKSYPSHANFAWVVSHRDVEAYRWFVSRLKEVQDCVINMKVKSKEAMRGKSFNFHIYVTSVPKDLTEEKAYKSLTEEEKDDTFWGIPAPESQVDMERANFSKADLYKALLFPSKESKTLGDIHVHHGRPNWDIRFEEMLKMYRNENVGVMFCGNPYIAADLKKMCAKHSSQEAEGTKFILHKENF